MATRKQVEHAISEHAEQCQVVEWAELMSTAYPELAMLFAVPNGGNRNIVTAVRLKAEGVRAGVPDLFLPVVKTEVFGECNLARYVHGLFIEMKKRKGGRTSTEQKWWIEKLREQNYRVEVCKGAAEAIAVLSEYLGIK